MKVLSCIGRPSQDGTKTYYSVALEKADGTQIGAFAFEAVNPGDMVEDSRIIPGKREGEWTLKSAPKAGGKGNWQPKDDSIIIAECAAKIVKDLVIAGKINPVKMADYEANFIIMAKAIKATAAAIKDPAAVSKAQTDTTKPATTAPAPLTGPVETVGIKNMGMLRLAIGKEYPTLKTTAAQDKVLGPDPITDFDAAFQKVKDYMEGLKI
jgi:hypothetical protein